MNRRPNFLFYLWGWLLAFTACDDGPNRKTYTVGFSQCTTGDSWRKAMHESMQRELAFFPDIKLIVEDAENDSKQQIQHINAFIEQEVDLLIVSPNESTPITPVIEEAYYKGIPIIIIDRRTNSDLYTTYIGADNYEIGREAGLYVAKILGQKGRIVEIWGLSGSSPAIARHQGFMDALKAFPDLEVIDSVHGKWEKSFVIQDLPALLKRQPDIDLIYAHNDRMALGAYQVLKEAERLSNTKIIGIDGLAGPNGGLDLVANNIIDATFLYPTGGEEAIQLAAKILKNEPFHKENQLLTSAIDSTNVRLMKYQTDKIIAQQKTIEALKHAQNELTNKTSLYQNLAAGLAILVGLGLVIFATIMLSSKTNNSTLSQLDDGFPSIGTTANHQTVSSPKFKKGGKTKEKDRILIEQFKALVAEQYSDADFGVQSICDDLQVSRVQLYRKVKKYLSCNVIDYIQKVRLEYAKELLIHHTDKSVSEIGFQVGYSSPSYFSTAFKTRFHISPSEFKAKYGNLN